MVSEVDSVLYSIATIVLAVLAVLASLVGAHLGTHPEARQPV